MAADHLPLRDGHFHRRPRPGRGDRARAREGASSRHQAAEHLHRGFARRVRARLRLPHVPGERALRGPISPRHLDRAAADRQAPDRDRGEGRRRCRRPWRDRQGQRPGALRAQLLRAQARRDRDRAMAGMGVALARGAHRLRRAAPAPDRPAYVEVEFERGDAVALDGQRLSPATLLSHLNTLGRAHGIGRLDLVENRFVGMKSRGMYETPGGTVLLAAHRGIETITLDRGAAHLKDELMPKYAELIYNGFWFSPEREMLQAAIDASQEFVTGTVKLKLYKGHVAVVGRSSPYSLYDRELVTFEEGNVAYDHRDAEGFIRLNALRLRTLAQRKKKLKPKT